MLDKMGKETMKKRRAVVRDGGTLHHVTPNHFTVDGRHRPCLLSGRQYVTSRYCGHLTWGTGEGTNPVGEPFGEFDGVLNARLLWVYVTDPADVRGYVEQG